MGHETNGNRRVRVFCTAVMWRRWPKVVVAVRDEVLVIRHSIRNNYEASKLYEQQMHPSIVQVNLSE